MNRIFGGGKNKGPSATNLQNQKSKQIESLRKVGAIEIIRDVEYRVVISQGTTNITVIINLPAQFPSEKPIVSVQPAVSHPWVDSQMKISGCPNIENFTMHSDLGSAVQAILDEFKKNPPAVVPQHYILGYNSPTVGTAVGAASVPTYPGQPLHQNQTASSGFVPPAQAAAAPPPLPPRRAFSASGDIHSPSHTNGVSFVMPNLSSEFPNLKDLKLYELQELVEDEDQIIEMAQKSSGLVTFSQQRESLSNICVQLAQTNLSKKPVIEKLKSEISEMYAQYEDSKKNFENNCSRHLSLTEHFHPSNLQTNLKVAVMEADEESEEIAEKFITKEVDIDEFLKSFMEKRKLCHLRRAKEEKLNQIIISQGLHFN